MAKKAKSLLEVHASNNKTKSDKFSCNQDIESRLRRYQEEHTANICLSAFLISVDIFWMRNFTD